MPNVYKELGKNIRKHRKNKGISTPDFAQRLDISTDLVNNTENGRYDVFKLELLLNIMKGLEVSLGEILQLDNINIRDINFQRQLTNIFGSASQNSNTKIDYLNYNLSIIFISYLGTLSKFNYNNSAKDYITNHLIEQLDFIKNIDTLKSEVPS